MKRISTIRAGLGTITDAIADFPPEPGYRGDEPGTPDPKIIWRGENPETLVLDDRSEDSDDDLGLAGAVEDFDPIFEIGADAEEKLAALDGKEGEKIRQSVMLYGMDALAWYVSFHHTGYQWGIYIPISGIAYMMKKVFHTLPKAVTLETKARLAFHALLNHELFHFATDYTIAQAELVHQEPWYIPAQKAFRKGQPKYCFTEELLANLYMLQAFRTMKPGLKVPGKLKALRAFVKCQPEGYCDALIQEKSDWEPNLEELGGEYAAHSKKGSSNLVLMSPSGPYDWAAQFPIRPKIDWRYCPIHLVDDGQRIGLPQGWLSFFSCITNISETPTFTKKLTTLAQPIQKAWKRTKQKLEQAITGGTRIKPWPKAGPNVYSIRLNDGYRAHLQYEKPPGRWLALNIGNHKEMGHG